MPTYTAVECPHHKKGSGGGACRVCVGVINGIQDMRAASSTQNIWNRKMKKMDIIMHTYQSVQWLQVKRGLHCQ